MAYNYYLLNGKNGKGEALNILVDGEIKRNFNDISALDLSTMDIPIDKSTEILKEYNPKTNLSGMFYNASYPHSKTKTKSYATIFNQENNNTKYYLDSLRYFAEQRKYKKEHNQKIKLDDNRELNDYIRKIIYNILYNNYSILTEYESIMSAKLKDILRDKYYLYPNMGIDNFINSRIYILKSILSNYTELRNITLEYILLLQGKNTNIRSKIKRTENWNNKGMEVVKPVPYNKGQNIIITHYNQMELADYLPGFPKVKTKKK